MNIKGCLIGVVLFLVVGALVFDLVFAVKPAGPPLREGEPSPARPQPGDDPFLVEPLADTFDARRALYLQWLLPQHTPDDRGGVWMDVGKLAAGAQAINPLAFQDALDFVNQRQDPSDFNLTSLIRLYYLNAGSGRLTSEQERAIQDALLHYKYWLDEPGTTYVEMWTENHQILSASAEYLAGQLFPDQVFSNDGLTGAQKMARARARLLRWIDLRARTGFAEWDSETYYPEDLAPLLNLVEFAEDIEVVNRATMLVDVILFDFAVDAFYGQYATSHGRVTASSIQSAAGASMTTVAALTWGQGRFQSTSNMGVIALATSRRYQVPPVISALALDNPEVYRNYERHSFPLEQAADYGLDIKRVNDAPLFWGMGAFTTPEVIDLTLEAADAWKLWHYPDFSALKDIAKVLQKTGTARLASHLLNPDPNGVLMTEVNKFTYRTPDFMLSSAQDFRAGEKGYQQHIWQATLGPYAVVFTTNPDSLRADDKHRPSYWMANGRQPRTGQVDNVLVALYDLPRYPSAPPPMEARHYAFTHAYFPRWAFDEVVEVPVGGEDPGGWIFGRLGDGYIGLYSHLPYSWQDSGPDAGQEVIAPGYKNVWICQLGRASVDGSFREFIQAVSQADLSVEGLRVRFDSPGNGVVAFDWSGPLTLDGENVPLRDYPRFDNPYAQVAFNSRVYEIYYNEMGLVLDFQHGVREIR
jgi:hypothetical protein